MKTFIFHIDSTAQIKAESEEEARKRLKERIENYKYIANEEALTTDEIMTGAQVGEVVKVESAEA